ncbi:calcium-binding and coiled-coil domain-containing protein 1-like [Takifugu flavidus]|uniref:calcium-binding and coiled-coil domain-containing protein 1-like n=1 Tax=Takifugu flavidus TaxID=433684 RepID=UPI002544C319|nr:calcium-binding and coiled-coil domain-containing protein 1-like [Takifugu flavidus]
MWQQKRNVRKTVNAETELMGRQREHPRDFESPENGLVLKERAYWKKQLHELQEKYDKQGRQLFYAEQHNRDLNDKLQQAKELNKKKDEEKASLQQQLDLRKGFNQKGEIQDERNGMNIPLNDINDSQELQNSEGSLEEEVGQPREVLPEREEQFREKSLRNEAHVDTLALLTQTEAALRESEEKSSRLEKELQEIVSEQGEKQLSRKEESVSMEPCGPDNQAINQLYDLCDHWENIINQMMETERKVQEEKKLQKLEETRLQQEIQHLHVKKVQLQQKKKKSKFWSWIPKCLSR